MKIALIELGQPSDRLSWTTWQDERGRFAMPTVGLVAVASAVPEAYEVIILDEKLGNLPAKIDADLVALSFKTMYARRAYEVADSLRSQGTPVVVGGSHASLVPDQAAAHADSVVVGEAESVWPRVITDFETGNLERIYRASPQPAPLDRLPPQRVEVVDHSGYSLHAMQSARGCSFTCEFCPTRAIFGDGFRLRNVDALVAEAERLVALDPKPILFTENVFGAGKLSFISELADRLSSRGIRYGVSCDWFMLNEDIVTALAAGGCKGVCVNTTGRVEPKEIAALDAVHAAGIPIWGYFMFGFEEDRQDVFERAVKRARKYDMSSATIALLTPFPGTPMGERLAREGRIFRHDLDLYDHVHVHFEPNQMTVEELEQGFDYVCDELADLTSFGGTVRALEQA